MPEQFQGLTVRQVADIAADTLFQVVGVSSLIKHPFVIIGFEKYGMAPAEMLYHMLTRAAYVGHNPDRNAIMTYGEAMGIGCIVTLRESAYIKATYL